MRNEICKRFDRFFNLITINKQTSSLKLVELNPIVDRDLTANLRHLEATILKTIQLKKLIKKTKPNVVNLFGQLLDKSPSQPQRDSVRLVKGTTLSSLPDDSIKFDNDISDSDMTSVDSGVAVHYREKQKGQAVPVPRTLGPQRTLVAREVFQEEDRQPHLRSHRARSTRQEDDADDHL